MIGEAHGLELPYMPAHQACYDAVREAAPMLWTALEDELVPLAASAAPVEERVRGLLEAEDRLWEELTERDRRATVVLGKSWHCAAEDLIAAVVETAATEIAEGDGPAEERRARLERLLHLLRDARPDSFSLASAGMDVRAAIADIDETK